MSSLFFACSPIFPKRLQAEASKAPNVPNNTAYFLLLEGKRKGDLIITYLPLFVLLKNSDKSIQHDV
jgi:hypothetical protein